jgi:hypothetical protein
MYVFLCDSSTIYTLNKIIISKNTVLVIWIFCTVEWRSAQLTFLFSEKCSNIYIILKYNRLSVEEQTRKNSNFPVRGIFKNPREIIVNIFR